MRSILVALLLCAPCSIADAQAIWGGKTYSGRVCSNPSCRMCASIQQQLSQAQTVQSQREHQDDQQYEMVTEYKTVQRRVKYCNGRRCWYETVTERVPVQVRRPIEQPKTVSKQAAQSPTPMPVVKAMIADLNLSDASRFYDLGCGDGRIVIAASKRYGCRSIGIEIDEHLAWDAWQKVQAVRLDGLVKIIADDARRYKLDGADAIAMYLYPDLMEQLVPHIATGTQVVSYQHEIPGVDAAERTVTVGGEKHRYFVGVKE